MNSFHAGVIKVDRRVAEEAGITFDRFDTQGYLQEKGIYEQLHKLLDLPASYTIYGLYASPLRQHWEVVVQHEDIPLVEESSDYPELTLHYGTTLNGTKRLWDISCTLMLPRPHRGE